MNTLNYIKGYIICVDCLLILVHMVKCHSLHIDLKSPFAQYAFEFLGSNLIASLYNSLASLTYLSALNTSASIM